MLIRIYKQYLPFILCSTWFLKLGEDIKFQFTGQLLWAYISANHEND